MSPLESFQRKSTWAKCVTYWLAGLTAAILVVALTGCTGNTKPQNTTEQIYVVSWSLSGALNGVADLKGVLNDEDYAKAKAVVLGADTAVTCAQVAQKVPGVENPGNCPVIPDGGGALAYLEIARALIMQAATWVAK